MLDFNCNSKHGKASVVKDIFEIHVVMIGGTFRYENRTGAALAVLQGAQQHVNHVKSMLGEGFDM